MPYWKDIWKRHKDKILAAILAIFLIIIISLSATHGKTKKVYVDTSGQAGTKSRYRTYYLTANDRPSYSLGMVLEGLEYTPDMNSIASESYLKLVHALENSLNSLLSSVDRKKDDKGKNVSLAAVLDLLKPLK